MSIFVCKGEGAGRLGGHVDDWLLGRKSPASPSIVVWPGRVPGLGRGEGSHGQCVPVMWDPPVSEGVGSS